MLCVLCVRPTGFYIGVVKATDSERDPFKFTMQGSPLFHMNTSGALFVDASLAFLNFEAVNSYNITVTVAESHNERGVLLASSTLLTVSVTNVNEAPFFTNVPTRFHVPSNALPGTNVTASLGWLTVNDTDAGDNSALTVSLPLGGNYFTAVSDSGGTPCRGNRNCYLVVGPSPPSLNFDIGVRSIPVNVTVTDPGGLSTWTYFEVDVDEVNLGVAPCPTRVYLRRSLTSLFVLQLPTLRPTQIWT